MIREIGENELQEALELVRTVFNEFVAADYSEAGVNSFYEYLETDAILSRDRMLGYYEGGRIKGVIATRGITHISLLFVDGGRHGNGIGKRLIAAVREAVKYSGQCEISVSSSPCAVGFYERMGFVCTDGRQEKNGIIYIPMVYKLKREVFKDDFRSINIPEPTVVTIGNFDGVHNGHRFLFKTTKQTSLETGLKSAVLTFSPHPKLFFGASDFQLITSDTEKLLIFEKLEMDYKVFVEFNEQLSSLSPDEFVREVLLGAMNCRKVVIGENYRFGRNRSGGVFELKKLCEGAGIEVEIFESVISGGLTVSSARIRKLITRGDITGANSLLGEPYFTRGEIIRGKGIGKTIGFPTINQAVAEKKILPKFGVYFTETVLDCGTYKGITNVGVRPTLGGTEKSIETFLIGFGRDAYGETATVRFLKRCRGEKGFDSLEGLKNAILRDKQAAEEFFGAEGLSDEK